jgi:hypothetical protein
VERILDGAQRDAALASVRDIAVALNDPPPCSVLEDLSEQAARITNATSLTRRCGRQPWLPFHHQRRSVVRSHRATADGRLCPHPREEVMTPTLFGGFVGIGWALARLRAWNVVDVAEQSFVTVDKALVSHLDRDDWPSPVELIYGLAGCLVYALARLPSPDAQRIVERGLNALEVTRKQPRDSRGSCLHHFCDRGHSSALPKAATTSASVTAAPASSPSSRRSTGSASIRRARDGCSKKASACSLRNCPAAGSVADRARRRPKPARVVVLRVARHSDRAVARPRALGRDDWRGTALRCPVAAEWRPRTRASSTRRSVMVRSA